MPLEEEVSELNEGDGAASIDIDPEDILHDIVDLILGFFMHDINNDFFNGFDVYLAILFGIFGEDHLEFAPEGVF